LFNDLLACIFFQVAGLPIMQQAS